MDYLQLVSGKFPPKSPVGLSNLELCDFYCDTDLLYPLVFAVALLLQPYQRFFPLGFTAINHTMLSIPTPSWLRAENQATRSETLSWAVTTMACMAMYIDTFQSTMVNFGLSAIMESLDMTPFDVNWVLIGYNLAFATILPISGAIVDKYGLRFGFLFGTGFLTWASALCAATPNRYGLIVGRVFCGIGAAMSVSCVMMLREG